MAGLSGSGLVLQNAASPNLTITANGTFSFPAAVAGGAEFRVTVQGQPSNPPQTCTVANGTGTVVSQNVTNVSVTCVTNTYSVKGTVSGLIGSGLVLQSTLGGEVAVGSNGVFTLPVAVTSGAAYGVVVKARPISPWQTCTVAKGSGTVGAADVTDVEVACTSDAFSVGGTVTGLNGSGLVLRNNGGSDFAVAANGSFTLSQTVLSGVAYDVTVATQPSSPAQKCTVAGASGVVGGGNVNIAISCANTYTIGGTITGLTGGGLVLRSSGGDDLQVYADGTFTFQVGLTPGSPYAVSVLAGPKNPVQTCSVANATGTVATVPIANIAVSCQTDHFAYVANRASNSISIYTINSVNGALTPAQESPFPLANAPNAIVFEPTNKFAYVTNQAGDSVSVLAADPVTGSLSLRGVEPAGVGVNSVAVDPLGRFLFVSNFAAESVAVYLIDATTGLLGQTAGSPFVIGGFARELKVDPTGEFLYVANEGLNSVNVYGINPVAGTLGSVGGSPFAVGSAPRGLAIDPAGDFVYVVNNQGNSISTFSRDAATGSLTPIAGSPFAATATPCSIAIDPQARFAFVSNSTASGTLSAFSIAGTGALTQISGSPAAAGSNPCSVAVNTTGRFVYTANANSANVSGYSIDQTTGALTPLPGSPYAAESGASAVVIR